LASNVDINYFVGLNQTGTSPNFSYFLAADFEEGAGQTSPSQNHAIISATPIVDNTWYHAAATYNATTGEFILYLNGAANTTLAVGPTAPHDRTAFSTHRSARHSTQLELQLDSSMASSTKCVFGTSCVRRLRLLQT
jgi:hypothetical protein